MTVLFARSHYSIGDSMLSPEQIAKHAKELGHSAAAVSDTMSVSGMVDFTNHCVKQEVKPIVGCRVYVVENPEYRVPPKASGLKAAPNPGFYVDLYIKNPQGFHDLMILLSKANTEEYFYYVPRVGLTELLDAMRGNALLAVPSEQGSVFKLSDYASICAKIKDAGSASESDSLMFRFYPARSAYFDRINSMTLDLASKLGVKVFAGYTALYEKPEDADTRDVYAAICSNNKMSDPWRTSPYIRDCVPEKIESLRARVMSCLDTMGITLSDDMADDMIAAQGHFESVIDYKWSKLPISLPKMAMDEFAGLVVKCKAG